ncbi:MAG: AmmeMemoRadiSam system protein B [Pseudomonadota bacterium]|nr:AmmeMemoRadiSam system protein B [Pseudomonadota bacterium]
MQSARPPAVAGTFYPADPSELSAMLRRLLAEAQPPPLRPKALIAPHAGYIYSGAIAAGAYALLRPLRASIKRVILLGPVHRVWTPGLALPGVEAFETPLGRVLLDQEAIAAIDGLDQIQVHPAAHAQEHSLEVQLPFLQSVLDDFTLVPLAVGGAGPNAVAEVLEVLWGGAETLIVVSSDLSHFLPYDQAQHVDRATVHDILRFNGHLVGEQACGCHPINGLLLAAHKHGLAPHLLDLRNSGDTAGDRNRVVGYASIAFTEVASTASLENPHVQ